MTPWASKNPLRMEGRGKAPPHINVEHPTIIGNPANAGSRGEAPALKSSCMFTAQHLTEIRNPAYIGSRGEAPAHESCCIHNTQTL